MKAKPDGDGADYPIDIGGVRDIRAKLPDPQRCRTFDQQCAKNSRRYRRVYFVKILISIDGLAGDDIKPLILFEHLEHCVNAALRPHIVTVEECQQSA
jgi:hypothetical protein